MRVSRLRRGEIIATVSAIALVVLVFAVPWFSFSGADGSHRHANAWTSLPTLRWLILVTALLGLLLGYLQATRSAPALPVALDQALVPLSAITTIALLIRLLTGAGSPLVGGFAGLVASAALTAGVFMSLREEQGWTPGPDHPVETVKLTEAGEPR